jgi:hypothetical protein
MRVRAFDLLLSGDVRFAWGLLFTAWGIVFVATLTGNGRWLHADPLTEHPSWTVGMNLLTFMVAWLVMTIAMMLPTSLPLIQLFAKVKREQNAQPLAATPSVVHRCLSDGLVGVRAADFPRRLLAASPGRFLALADPAFFVVHWNRAPSRGRVSIQRT